MEASNWLQTQPSTTPRFCGDDVQSSSMRKIKGGKSFPVYLPEKETRNRMKTLWLAKPVQLVLQIKMRQVIIKSTFQCSNLRTDIVLRTCNGSPHRSSFH
jgi:hypothetical protein